ncbi:MAG: mechanosensitive ion channel [Candidatus Latescibacterota bacterium]|jgi:small-conductance mechanosensitive channel
MGNTFSIDSWRAALSNWLDQLGTTVGLLLPAILGAVLILLVGWAISRLVQSLVRRALNRVGLDRTVSRLRLSENLERANIKAAPSAIVSRILYWILMLTFVLAAAETLGLEAVTGTIDRLIAYLPNVLAAVFIVLVGFLLARFVQRLVESGSELAGLVSAGSLGSAARGLVLVLTAIVAVEQLGLKTDVLVRVVTVVVATLGLTMGLAFALGSRTVMSHILAGHYLRKTLTAGQTVEVVGRKGLVDHVGAVSTVFRKGDKSWSIPNSALLEDVVEQ